MDGDYTGAEHTNIVRTLESLKTPAIEATYSLPEATVQWLSEQPEPFTDMYSLYTFLDKYSRLKENGKKERWYEVVIRCVEGTAAAEIDHRIKNGLLVDYDRMDEFTDNAARSMFRMEWVPPGRGLSKMNTKFARQNGCASLNNCYAVSPGDDIIKAMEWTMDQLMNGGGVGVDTIWTSSVERPDKSDTMHFSIPDTRQGWVAALALLLGAYIPVNGKIRNKFPIFDYTLVRAAGEPIKGFEGTASGPGPLREMLIQIEVFLDTYIHYSEYTDPSCILTMIDRLVEADAFDHGLKSNKVGDDYIPCTPEEYKQNVEAMKTKIRNTPGKTYGRTRLIVDIINAIGNCVVSGNVRRSAEIVLGEPEDDEFFNLKNYEFNPERAYIGYASNNTIRFPNNEKFNLYLEKVVKGIQRNGEPGFFNLINTQKFARMGDKSYGPDPGTLLNPCGETILCSYEPCTLSVICPPKCIFQNADGTYEMDWYRLNEATRFATWYATVVTTIRHHWKETNDIMMQNRRIGVGQTGITNTYELLGPTRLTQISREMYDTVRRTNTQLAKDLKINRAIRTTVVKPDGTMSIILQCNAGVHFALKRYCERRMIVPKVSKLVQPLIDAGYPMEPHMKRANSLVVSFPITSRCKRVAADVPIFEQFTLAAAMQRCFADNSVSFTGTFIKPRECDDVSNVLPMFAPIIKACSMLGMTDGEAPYEQAPFGDLTEEKYNEMVSKIKPFDVYECFNQDRRDAQEERYCNGDICLLRDSVDGQ